MLICKSEGDILNKLSYKNWFCEKGIPGKRSGNISHCFLIKKLIFQGKTHYQKILIIDNSLYGRVFVLDGIVQLSERDEFIYHEMISHPVLFSHPCPKNILIIGGGDGGALREVLKHPVKKVDLVEIDEGVIGAAKKYLKFVCQNSFFDKRVKIHFRDGAEFLKNKNKLYDILIVDCTNPGEEAISSSLYSSRFLQRAFLALKENGIMITLGASFLDFENFIKPFWCRLSKIFPHTHLIRFTMPSYHCGEYCFIAGSKKINLAKVNFKKIEKKFKKFQKKLKYYSPKIHQASLLLPSIWQL